MTDPTSFLSIDGDVTQYHTLDACVTTTEVKDKPGHPEVIVRFNGHFVASAEAPTLSEARHNVVQKINDAMHDLYQFTKEDLR